MEEKKIKKVNGRSSLFDFANISTKKLEEDLSLKKILDDNGIKNYEQLKKCIQEGKITDYYLVTALYEAEDKFNFDLEDILVDSLRVNKQANHILNRHNITTFKELDDSIKGCVYAVVSNEFLVKSLKVATQVLESIRETSKSRK